METGKTQQEVFEYRAEMKQLLNLIVHSLYTHPEVFLRELVSNSSDALNKVRFLRLSNPEIPEPEAELRIDINLDPDNATFSIEDSGIGMTKDDLINQIGTIASSGTLSFLQKLIDNQNAIDGNLIGQFGVGFYSVFMVTDEITLETRYADKESKAYKWISSGEDKFVIEECDRTRRGTKISFRLKDDFKEYSRDFKIKEVLRKYSNFVDFPIYVNNEKVNVVTALWHSKKEDVKDEELEEFYKFISSDFSKPLGHLFLSIEGSVNFKALLFIPESAPLPYMREISEKSLHLYSSKVFIQDDSRELLPEYLRFIKGVVDTEDLPLNVSREVTQSSPVMAKIRKVLTEKLLSMFEEWSKDDYPKFEKFYKNFGNMIKTGINSDYANKDRLTDLLRFESTLTEPGKMTSLKDYVARISGDQKEIYYVSGDSRDSLEKNPNLEYFRKKGIEVLLLTDPVDIFTIPYLFEYDHKQLKSIEKADLKLDGSDSTDDFNKDEINALVNKFKSVLAENVEDVIISKRLFDSPVTLVLGEKSMDTQMEKMMKMFDKDYNISKRILEINPSHPIIRNLSDIHSKNPGNPLLDLMIKQLYEGSLLIDGYLKSPVDFVTRMHEIMVEASRQ